MKITFLWLFGNASDSRLPKVFVILHPTGKVFFRPCPVVSIVPPVVIPLAAFPFCKLPGHIRGGSLNILAARNHESGNLEIRVLVLGNRLFCAWLRFHFYENICQGLAASAVRSSLYEYSCRNYDSICTKVNLKSDFHIAGQLMEPYPEYSGAFGLCPSAKPRLFLKTVDFKIS